MLTANSGEAETVNKAKPRSIDCESGFFGTATAVSQWQDLTGLGDGNWFLVGCTDESWQQQQSFMGVEVGSRSAAICGLSPQPEIPKKQHQPGGNARMRQLNRAKNRDRVAMHL